MFCFMSLVFMLGIGAACLKSYNTPLSVSAIYIPALVRPTRPRRCCIIDMSTGCKRETVVRLTGS